MHAEILRPNFQGKKDGEEVVESQIEGGYVIVSKNIMESEIMDKPGTWTKLWLWMLCKANYKNSDTLKRGQLITTIAEMQEAMSYKIGYRKKIPTKDEVRGAYSFFIKSDMITTRKTTRGMVITICNYAKYQNPDAYKNKTHNETHAKPTTKPTTKPTHEDGLSYCNSDKYKNKKSHEAHNENATKPEATPHYIKEENNKKNINTPPIPPPKKKSKPSIEYPPWLDMSLWDEFKQYRKEIKNPLIPTAEKVNIDDLKRLTPDGKDQKEIIHQTIANGWKGLFPIKNKRPKQITGDRRTDHNINECFKFLARDAENEK